MNSSTPPTVLGQPPCRRSPFNCRCHPIFQHNPHFNRRRRTHYPVDFLQHVLEDSSCNALDMLLWTLERRLRGCSCFCCKCFLMFSCSTKKYQNMFYIKKGNILWKQFKCDVKQHNGVEGRGGFHLSMVRRKGF